ncbi:MAG: N-6 DNA methylase [Bacteroidales bacterium]|nr:N-6 DNA methylase [Bacteroidales bacterium]
MERNELDKLFKNGFAVKTWSKVLVEVFKATEIRTEPEYVAELSEKTDANVWFIGEKSSNTDYTIGYFAFEIKSGSVVHKRVGLRNLAKAIINSQYGVYDSVVAVFYDKSHWRCSFISDIRGDKTAPKRFSFVFGDPKQGYKTAISRFMSLQLSEAKYADIKAAFSVEALTKEFYGKLFNWYLWAVDEKSNITFPNRTDTDQDDRENIQTKILRLITRLMFVWFIKQKHLVPDSLFDEKSLGGILRNFDHLSKTEGNYYNAILQNLFFATLNQEIADRQFISDKKFQGKSDSFTIKNLYRDNENKSWFSFSESDKKQRVMQLFETVPYLNGGLFDCLDKFKYDPETKKLIPDKFYDGFSSKETRSPNGNYKYRAFVPNCFFFAPEHKEIVKDNSKEQEKDVCGLIELFRQYNFTVEENSPDDSEVSLDPELLGKVFENLLAAYNPETHDSARKSTGSYYTPREIVDYMVNESLINYLTVKCGHQETSIRALFNDQQPTIPDNALKVANDLRNIRILDPACGSGAFPMGILLRITAILERLQPTKFNKYQTKIDIIKNCIFGIDIQPIAMLICKLRFFITLICDSEYKTGDKDNNFGIIPLPSLETKFVAANSLVPAQVRKYDNDWTQDDYLLQMKQQLIDLRKQALEIRSHKARSANQAADIELCNKIEQYIISTATQPDKTKIEKWQRQIETDKIELQKYQSEQWVDNPGAQQSLFGFHEPSSTFRRDINAHKRSEINTRINNCVDAITREQSKSASTGFTEAIRQVTRWNPYDQNSVSPFFDPDWMFGITDGFNIVIGNPPYLKEGRVSKDIFDIIKDTPYYQGKMDLWYAFGCLGIDLLKNNGVMTFIATNNWTTNSGASKFRNKVISDTKILQMCDFGDARIFENASIQTMVMMFQKDKETDGYTFDHRHLFIDSTYSDALDLLIKKPTIQTSFITPKIKRNEFKNKFLTFSVNDSIFDKILENDVVYLNNNEATNGIHTHFDCVSTKINAEFPDLEVGKGMFVLTDSELHELQLDDYELQLIKPFYTSDEIERFYTYKKNQLWIIYTDSSFKDGKKMIKFPKLKKHLDSVAKAITSDNRPYGLHRAREERFFIGEKIIAQRKCPQKPIFSYNNFDCYVSAMYYIIQTTRWNMKFLTGLLNSKLVKYWLRYKGKMQGMNFQVDKEPLQSIPLLIPSKDRQETVAKLVDFIISIHKNPERRINEYVDNSYVQTVLEDIIDALIFEMYFSKEFAAKNLHIYDKLQEIMCDDVAEFYKRRFHSALENEIKLMEVDLKQLLLPIISN